MTVDTTTIDWEATFISWGSPPSATEQAKCENAERAIRKAILASNKLGSKNIRVFAQGSYANRTNVSQDSDVDICVLYTDSFFTDYTFSESLNDAALEFTDGAYTYYEFKNDVEEALKSYFGPNTITRGDKAFDVHANTYRIDADVVPCFEHRRYDGTTENHYYTPGTEILTDAGERIVNWPQQNYDNGIAKNSRTARKFKAITRILKNLRHDMLENGRLLAKPISSYLIECLVWNVPDEGFTHNSYMDDVRYVIAHLWNETRTYETCSEWGEVNELKYLFRATQPWTFQQVNLFLEDVWNYIGFQNEA
jgi:predicted nucleotidyltransferase